MTDEKTASGRLTTKKCVVVGDGGVGKTSLLSTFATGVFPEDYVPTVFDNYVAAISVGGKSYELGLFDTAGQEDYDRLRPLAYPRTDVFIVCFCIVSMKSFKNVREKWLPELKHHGPMVPILLVGTQADLRGGTELRAGGRNQLGPELGKGLAKEIGAAGYLECSAKTGKGLESVFQEAIHASGAGKQEKRKQKGNIRNKMSLKKNSCILL